MTCIIGINCVDGIVLASDQRILRGTEYSDEPKIVEAFQNFLIGASGLTGIRDKFIFEMQLFLNIPRDERISMREFLLGIEDITFKLYERYEKRLHISDSADIGAYHFDALMVYKQFENRATLSHMYSTGFSTNVNKFDVIGHGRPSALPFIKALYHESRTMNEMSKVAAFTLSLLDEAQIDLSVGGDPKIFNLPDNGDARELSKLEINNMVRRSPTLFLEGILNI